MTAERSSQGKASSGAPATGAVRLREIAEADLEILFEQQNDPVAYRMAAFPPRDRPAFMAHWATILRDRSVRARAIVVVDDVAGYVACFEKDGRRLVGYWLGRTFWGRGFATAALRLFLREIPERPLYALVARTNLRSIRVLEKCGFAERSSSDHSRTDSATPVQETLFRLDE